MPRFLRTILILIPALLVLLLALGCSSPAERAEKLFKEGKYEEILERYPQEPAAVKAREALAAKLLKEGQYERVLKDFSDTPLAHDARVRYAEQLLGENKIEEVLTNYSDTPAAIKAREVAAQQLYDAGRVTEAARDYPQTPAGSKARDEISRAEYERIMTFRDSDQRRQALEEFLTNPLYAGSSYYSQAQYELAKLDGFKNQGNY